MIKIVICDDDPAIHTQMTDILAAYSITKNEEIDIASLTTTEELMQYCDVEKFDILFLDIRFNQEDIGIAIAKQIRQKGIRSVIILLTSLNSKAIEGYEIGAYRYLVKPFSKECIFAVLNTAIAEMLSGRKVILLKRQYETEVIRIAEILYIQSVSRKQLVVTEVQTVETWDTLKSIYTKLPSDQFAYAQKSFVVNYDKVSAIKKNALKLLSGERIAVSRQYKDTFFSGYFQYIGR